MKVLVTGANGYIGSHVVKELLNHNHEVVAIDLSKTNLPDKVEFLNIDIFQENKMIFDKVGKPDILIHLAWKDGFNHMAPSHIQELHKHVNFLENMIQGGLKQVAIMGTMHEVGYWEGAIDENTPCNPKSFYGISKNSLRQIIEILSSKNKICMQWIRAYYIYGDDRRSNSIFGKLLCANDVGTKEFPLNSGKNLYDFIHINELAKQIVDVVEQTKVQGIINCCSGKPISLLEQITAYIEERGLTIKLNIGAFPDRPYDSPGVWGDDDKIKEIRKHLGD
ncbi:MAG: NAD(P)-dependent oxidoreductase [Erysipelotrichales bacterium]|nr:NAD(P)-dependent oxidoreductase [Erysipelotrichales bacterium]